MKLLIGILLFLLLLAAVISTNPWWFIVHGMALADPPALLVAREEPGARWFDDYYTVFQIDDNTFAIGETRYWQANFNYLIVGHERALLFDGGPGIRDIRPVVRSLTELPVTFMPSHLHYDHVANGVEFEDVAVIDLPYLRQRAPDNRLTLELQEHLGVAEGFDEPFLAVTEWLQPGTWIDLGGRKLQVLHTPGHTLNSVSLVDPEAGYAFTGDFFYPGALLAMVPSSGMGDYLYGIEVLLDSIAEHARLFGAHRDVFAEPRRTGVPELSIEDLRDARTVLMGIRDGEVTGRGVFPVVYDINQNLGLWSYPTWLQEWNLSRLDASR